MSLFNLEEDPQEVNNLAKQYPRLVEELLEEAEEVLRHAPPQWRGDMIHEGAPVSSEHGWMSALLTKGTHFDDVIPFGIYLEDEEDLTKLKYVRMLRQQLGEAVVIITKLFLVLIMLPLIFLFGLLSILFSSKR